MKKLKVQGDKVGKGLKPTVRKTRISRETKDKIWELAKEVGVATAMVVLNTLSDVLKDRSSGEKRKKGKKIGMV